jgi:hypothetical protein
LSHAQAARHPDWELTPPRMWSTATNSASRDRRRSYCGRSADACTPHDERSSRFVVSRHRYPHRSVVSNARTSAHVDVATASVCADVGRATRSGHFHPSRADEADGITQSASRGARLICGGHGHDRVSRGMRPFAKTGTALLAFTGCFRAYPGGS